MSTEREREVESRLGVRRHELLKGVEGVTQRVLQEHGVGASLAALAANAVADWVAHSMRGQVISFPSDTAYRLADQHLQIWDESRAGATYDVLAIRYGLSERHIRSILADISRRLERQAKARKIPPAQRGLLED